MSRTRNFVHAVWSGYMFTAATSLANLITYAVALATVGKPAFGLWGAVLQVSNFTNIFDMGLGPSLARFITDYKDDRSNKAYANFLKSVFFVGACQGVLFSIAALCLTPFLPDVLGIQPEQHSEFKKLLLLQFVVTAIGFPLRPLSQILYANQQIARINACCIVGTVVNVVALLLGFQLGWGLYSFVVASWAAFVVMQAGIIYYTIKLHLLPDLKGASISFKALKPLAVFSSNVFIIVLGVQLINFAPTLLITRKLGLAALTDWMFGTRLVLLAWQLISRISNASEPAFWEMYARQELALLRRRLTDLFLLVGSAAALFAAGIAAINPPFITLWTNSRVDWLTVADVALVAWLAVLTAASVFNMVPGMTKHVGGMKFIYLLESGILISLGYLPFVHLDSHWQIALILFVCVSVFRFPYGLYRACKDLQIPGAELAKALLRTLGVAFLLLAAAVALRQATTSLPPLAQIAVNGIAYSLIALPTVYYLALPVDPKQRLQQALRSFRSKLRL